MFTGLAAFITAVTDVATGMIDAVIAGMGGIAAEAIVNPVVALGVGIGLMFVGIHFIPRLISMIRHR